MHLWGVEPHFSFKVCPDRFSTLTVEVGRAFLVSTRSPVVRLASGVALYRFATSVGWLCTCSAAPYTHAFKQEERSRR